MQRLRFCISIKLGVILMAKFIERLIECPFYLGEGDKFINCEGEDGNKYTRLFDDNTEKAEYEKGICSVNGGRGCSHYKIINRLYEFGKLPR